MPILLSLYKIGVLLPSAFRVALKPTTSIAVGCVPQKSIAGAVGATLGNAPYGDCDRTTRLTIAQKSSKNHVKMLETDTSYLVDPVNA